ncbi:MAG: FAD-dependent oxidoreductase [Rhodospirillales bacterium]
MTEQRVLIAGAGPVGCVAALHLARNGVKVTILEACDDLPEDLRASTFHPPTLDMLGELGLVDKLIAQGIICPVWQNRDTQEGIVAEWDLGVLKDDTAHPYRVQAEQFRLTRIAAAVLRTMPEVTFRFGARAAAVTQDADGVTLEVETAEGTERLRGAYLIAADGASSVIRKGLDIDFPGLTFPELWLVVSTPYDFGKRFERLAPIAYVADPENWFVFVSVPGLWRLLFPTRPGETAESILQEETIQSRIQFYCPKDGPYDIVHRTAYAVHQRVAASYRSGRVLLAGDSAHINNPLGGMGMNGGIHDAVNLAEKLVAVLRGEADAALLDRYERQRRPIAVEYVQAATLRNKALLEEKDPAKRRARHDELRRIAEDPQRAREFLRQSSMIAALEKAATVE